MECSGHGNSPTKVPVARERKMSFTATSGEFLAAFHEEDEKIGPGSKMAAGGLGAAGTGSPHEQQQRTVQPSDGAVPCSTEDRLLEYAAPSWHQQLEEGSAFAHRPDYADSSHANVMESQLTLEAGNRSLPSKPDQRRTIMQKRTGKGRSKKNPNLQSRMSLDNFGGQMRPQQCPKQRFRGVLGRPGEEHRPRPSRDTRGPAEEGLGGGGGDDGDNAGAQPPQLPPPPPPLPAAAPTGCFDSEYRAQFTWRPPPPPPRGGGAWAGPRGVREGGGGGDELAASLERDSLEEGGGRRSGARAQSSCRAAPRPSRPPPPALLSSSMERDSLGGGRVQPALDSGKAIYEPGGTESQLGNDSSKFSEKPSYDGSPFHATKEHTPRHSSGIDEEGGSGRGATSPPASPPAPPLREEEGGRGKGETGRRRRRRGGGRRGGGREGAAGGGGGLGVPAAAAAAAACPHARLRRSGHCLACRPRAVRGPDVLAEKGLWNRLHKDSPRQRKEECPRETQLQDQAVIKNVSTNLKNHLEDQGKRLWNQAERKKKNHSYFVAVPLGGDSFRTDPKCSQVFFHPRLPLRSTLGDRRASEYARSYAWPPPLLS